MLSKLSMRARLSAVFIPAMALSLLSTLFLAWHGYAGLMTLRKKTEELESRATTRVAELGQLQKLLMKASISLRDVALSSSEEQRLKFVEGREKVIAELLEKLTELKKNPTTGEELSFKRLDDNISALANAVVAFDKEWKGKHEGPLPEKTVSTLADMIWNFAVPIRGKVEEIMIELSDYELAHQKKLADAAKQTYLSTRDDIIYATLFSTIVTFASALLALFT